MKPSKKQSAVSGFLIFLVILGAYVVGFIGWGSPAPGGATYTPQILRVNMLAPNCVIDSTKLGDGVTAATKLAVVITIKNTHGVNVYFTSLVLNNATGDSDDFYIYRATNSTTTTCDILPANAGTGVTRLGSIRAFAFLNGFQGEEAGVTMSVTDNTAVRGTTYVYFVAVTPDEAIGVGGVPDKLTLQGGSVGSAFSVITAADL